MAVSPATTAASVGVDVNAIVSGLMTIERQPITKLQNKVTADQAQLSALGLIKSQIANFQTAVQGLGSSSSSSLVAFNATPSDTSVFSATAGSTAVAGAYSLEVTKLAKAQQLASAGQLDQAAVIGSGTLTFDFGAITGGTLDAFGKYNPAATSFDLPVPPAPKTVTIDASNNTLQGIRDAINSAKIGVTATIVNDGSATPYRLALSSDSTGKANSIRISVAGDAALANLLDHDPTTATQNLNETVTAQNADFKVNGIQISKSSNTVADAIQGVTLNLYKETTAPVTLTVARDTAAITDKVTGFVTAYNNLYSALKTSSAYKSKQPLEGDATLRALQSQLRSIASSQVSGGTLQNLFEVGVNFSATGVMQLDSAKLNSAMSTNFSDVANLFNSATGYATQFDALATTALASGGSIATRTDGINKKITGINKQIDTLNVRLTGIEKNYRTLYSSLNTMLVQMSQTSQYLTRQLG